MAEQKPNDPSSKSKAEGERWRSIDEEITNQESVPLRGKSQSGRDRGRLDTPRRYDQPIEDDDDPVMPSDAATVNTKI